MRVRYAALIVAAGLAFLTLIPSAGLTQYPGGSSTPGGSTGGDSGYGGYGRSGSSRDPGTRFDWIARGETSIPLNDGRLNDYREPLAEWTKRTNFTGSALTKEQFVQFAQSPEYEAYRNRRMQGFGGRSMSPQGPSTTQTPQVTPTTPNGPVLIVIGGQQSPSSSTQSVQVNQSSSRGSYQSSGREAYEFSRRDNNGDGVLSYDEMSDTLKGEREQWDVNRDGVVSQEEYSAYFQAKTGGMGQSGWGQSGWGGDQSGWNQGGWGQQQQQASSNTPSDPDSPMKDPGALRNYRGSEQVLYIEVTGRKQGGTVWGTDIYTDDSLIAKAAVHSGVVKDGEKKVVKVTLLGPQNSFQGSERNEVKTNDYGPWERSFKIEATTGGKTPVYRAGKLPDNVPAWFKELDRDLDGQVALYEWKAKDKVVDEFRDLDRNGDGFVTFQEAVWSTTRPKPSGSALASNDPSKTGRSTNASGRGTTPETPSSSSRPFGFNPGGSQGTDPKTQGGQGGKDKDNKDNKSMSDRWFVSLSKGKDTITLSEVSGWMGGDKMREWAKKKGITTGTLTREQFNEYQEEQRKSMGQGGFGRPMGGGNGDNGSKQR